MTNDNKALVERLRDSFTYDQQHYAPDPLVEALNSAPYIASAKETAAHIRAALAARGLEIREVGHE